MHDDVLVVDDRDDRFEATLNEGGADGSEGVELVGDLW